MYVFKLDREADLSIFESIAGVVSAANELTVDGPIMVLSLVPETDQRSEALYNVMETLRAQAFELRGVAQRQQNLESIFLQLTTSSI